MTRQESNKIGEFLTFLEFFRAVPVFSWKIEEDDTYPDGCRLLVHVHNPLYLHEVIHIISGISGVTFFNWHVYYSNDYALDIFLY